MTKKAWGLVIGASILVMVSIGVIVFQVMHTLKAISPINNPRNFVEDTHIVNEVDDWYGLNYIFFPQNISDNDFNEITTEMNMGEFDEHKEGMKMDGTPVLAGFFVNEKATNKLQWYQIAATNVNDFKNTIVKKKYYDVNVTFNHDILSDLVINHSIDLQKVSDRGRGYIHYYNFLSEDKLHYLVRTYDEGVKKSYVYSAVDGKDYTSNFPKLTNFVNTDKVYKV